MDQARAAQGRVAKVVRVAKEAKAVRGDRAVNRGKVAKAVRGDRVGKAAREE